MCWPVKGWSPTVWITGSISLLGTLGFSSFNNAVLWMSEPQIVFTSHVSPCLSTSSPRCLTNSDFCRRGILFAWHWFLEKIFFCSVYTMKCLCLLMCLLGDPSSVAPHIWLAVIAHLQPRRQPTLIFYWCSFKVCELLSGGHDSPLTSLHIQTGGTGEGEGGSSPGEDCLLQRLYIAFVTNLLKKAVLFIKPVITDWQRTKTQETKST